MKTRIKTAFVLAAGYGSRLRPLTDLLPKPLLPMGRSSPLEKIFDKLAKAGIERAIVNTHHLSGAFDKFFDALKNKDGKILYKKMEIVKVFEPEILDTGGALKNARKLLEGEEMFLVHNADIIFTADIAAFMRGAEKIFAKEDCAAVACLRDSGKIKNVGVSRGKICDMRFSTKAKAQKNMQYTGVFAAGKKFLECACAFKQKKFSAVDVFLKLLSRGETPRYIPQNGGSWSDIGSPAQYLASCGKSAEPLFAALAKTAEAGFIAKNFTLIQKGASTRNFLRFQDEKSGEKLVSCIYSKQKLEDALYAPIAAFLKKHGLDVPEIRHFNARRRVLIMRDCGSTDLLKLETETPNKNAAIYRRVLQNLKTLHTTATAEFLKKPFELSQPFDDALYQWEQDYFKNECMRAKFAAEPSAKLCAELASLKKFLLKQDAVLLHRDCQSQNIMVENGSPALIDFQGMRLGCALYDVASLLFDPYVNLSQKSVESLAKFYFGAKPDGRQTHLLYCCACERLMQALGAFGFLSIKKGKAEYANYFKPALKRLIQCAGKAGLPHLRQAAILMLAKARGRRLRCDGN